MILPSAIGVVGGGRAQLLHIYIQPRLAVLNILGYMATHNNNQVSLWADAARGGCDREGGCCRQSSVRYLLS